MRSATMPYSGFSWNVQYFGSFPITKFNTESISKRLDKFVENPTSSSKPALLTVSLTHVALENENFDAPPFLLHSLRKVCCVIGRTEKETCQFAYITREATTLNNHQDVFKRQFYVHVFRAHSSTIVEEIETVLSKAFQRSAISTEIMPFPVNPKPPLRHNGMTPLRTSTPKSYLQDTKAATSEDLSNVATTPLTPGRKRKSFLEKSCRQMSNTTIFLQKLFGSGNVHPPPRNSSIPNRFEPETTTWTPKAATVGQSFLRSAQKFENLTPIGSAPRFGFERRRKRPVSAVFGQAISKLSHSATTGDIGKKHSTIPESDFISQALTTMPKDCPNEKTPNENDQPTGKKITKKIVEPKLEFDEKLQENIYPIGEYMDGQLQELAYFCRNPKKEEVMNHLLTMPEGTFVLRYSESRKRCLALSVRVPQSHGNHTGISHYLIVWNEKGFRIKGSKRYFRTIPMLITHHTVISEHLPCRLVFIELDSTIIKKTNPVTNGERRSRHQHNNFVRQQHQEEEDTKPFVNTSSSSTEINRTVVKLSRRSSSFITQR